MGPMQDDADKEVLEEIIKLMGAKMLEKGAKPDMMKVEMAGHNEGEENPQDEANESPLEQALEDLLGTEKHDDGFGSKPGMPAQDSPMGSHEPSDENNEDEYTMRQKGRIF